MKLEVAISKRIIDLCKERDLTTYKLIKISGVAPSTIKSILYGKSKNVGTRTILDICEALNITIYDFFNDDIFKSRDIEGSYWVKD